MGSSAFGICGKDEEEILVRPALMESQIFVIGIGGILASLTIWLRSQLAPPL